MARHRSRGFLIAIAIGVSMVFTLAVTAAADEGDRALSLSWDKEMLAIRGKHLPGGALEVWYIEAYCRPGSTARDWKKTVIPHKTELVESDQDGRRIKLRSRLDDGVEVDHEIRAGRDEIDFRVVATNPTAVQSQAQWAQPCIRVDRFTGSKAVRSSEDYLPRCFIYVDGKPARLPTTPWARTALYTPGQVWCPEGVSRDDVNPRPLSSIVPSDGLIGCESADGKELLATAWEPYQELFQGVIVCLHSDFRIGGLKPGQSKTIRGKIYLMPAGVAELETRYHKDFPEHLRRAAPTKAGASGKKLIEFGWDEPGTGFLRSHRAELEATPFDGCVFHAEARPAQGAPVSFTWLGWGRRRFTPEELKAARDDLESIGEARFRHNFLRFNTTPADLDWFDDHSAVVDNARLAAQLARAGHCLGILLDTEQYQGKLFDYARQRDEKRRTWDDYAAQARRRGREVMTALQGGYPDLTVFLTFGHSLLWKQGEHGKKPLAECRYGLLVPFLDGMIDAARGRTRIVDGHEMSYGYRDADAFATAYRSIKQDAETLAADRDAYRRVVSAGFGLWLDYDWRKTGWNMADLEKNYFSPERFEASLRAAIDQSDEFVWIYTEKPRWWSGSGKAVDLPSAYIEAVRRARRAMIGE
jgi:hypothetical protein